MRTNTFRIQQLLALIRKDGPSNEVLKQVVIALADEVISLERELDRVATVAARADRNARMGTFR
jgi:hypothetical protein